MTPKRVRVSDVRDLAALARGLDRPTEELRELLEEAVAVGALCRVESGGHVGYGLSPWGPT